ncbi:MAG: hypothetical protein JWO32_2125 [Bacteroidetes bacterium]|nr:hypothetical protein [Bacteroidota bacterium]
MILNKRISFIFIIFTSITVLFSCKKPGLGTYLITVEGEEYSRSTYYNTSSNPTTYTTTTRTYPYFTTGTLHLTYSGNSVLEFDGDPWEKTGAHVTKNGSSRTSSPGSNYSGSFLFKGDIISKNLITGVYTSTSSGGSGYSGSSATVTATFKIERK